MEQIRVIVFKDCHLMMFRDPKGSDTVKHAVKWGGRDQQEKEHANRKEADKDFDERVANTPKLYKL